MGGTTGKVYQRDLDMSGDNVAHQRAGNPGSENSFPNLSQGSEQHGCFDLPKNGWYKESKNYKNNRGDLGIFTFEWDHDYCGVSSQCPKQISRSGISTKILCK